MAKKNEIVQIQAIENKIYILRGQRVMLDRDLADVYGVETRVLNQAVKRNNARFPKDFMFQLSEEEFKHLRSQNVILKNDELLRSQNVTIKDKRGKHPKYLPYAFTEHGTVMLASVLKSQTAIEASIQIVKAFVKFREIIASQSALAKKIDELENKYDDQFKQVFDAIRQLMMSQPHIATTKKGRKD